MNRLSFLLKTSFLGLLFLLIGARNATGFVLGDDLTPKDPPVFVINRLAEVYDIPAECLYVFTDTANRFTFSEVAQKDWLFSPMEKDFRIEGQVAYWLKIRVQNRLPLDKEWIFVAAQAMHIEFYEPDPYEKDSYLKRQNGRLVPYAQKDLQGFIDYSSPVRIHTLSDSVTTYYLKVYSEKFFFVSEQFEPAIIEKEFFMRELYFFNLAVAFFLGALFVMAIYNLLLFLVIKDRVYLHYVLFIAFGALFYGYFYGLAYEWIWPQYPLWDLYSFMFLLSFTFFFWIHFTRVYLQADLDFPRIGRWLKVLAWVSFLPSVLTLYEIYLTEPGAHLFKQIQAFQNILIILDLIAILGTGIYIWWWRRDAPSRTFNLANLVLLVGSLLLALRFFYLVPNNFLVNNAAPIGFFFQVILFSLGLADRIKLLREKVVLQQLENEKLAREKQLQKHKFMAEKNRELEQKVAERTQEIYQQKEEIITQSELLKEQNQELEKVNQLKDKLFSIISHDLRSPLRSLKAMLGLSSKGYMTKEEFMEISRQLEETVNSALTLLENLLSWARSQLQGVEVRAVTIDVAKAVAENFELIQAQAQRKNISLLSDIQPATEVMADAEMLNLVLRNLLSNAVKFTYEGGQIQVLARQTGSMVEMMVKDNGMGISPTQKERLLKGETFTTQGTANEKGTGLGLVLCREYIQKNGGHIRCETEQEKGTTFIFTLPKSV